MVCLKVIWVQASATGDSFQRRLTPHLFSYTSLLTMLNPAAIQPFPSRKDKSGSKRRKSTILALPPEILSTILRLVFNPPKSSDYYWPQHLPDTRAKDLLSFALVSKSFLGAALPTLYHDVCLARDLEPIDFARFLSDQLKTDKLSYIRRLDVAYNGVGVEKLEALLNRCKDLHELRLPQTLADSLPALLEILKHKSPLNLESFHFTVPYKLNSATLQGLSFPASLRQIRLTTLRSNHNFAPLFAIFETMPNLQEIFLVPSHNVSLPTRFPKTIGKLRSVGIHLGQLEELAPLLKTLEQLCISPYVDLDDSDDEDENVAKERHWSKLWFDLSKLPRIESVGFYSLRTGVLAKITEYSGHHLKEILITDELQITRLAPEDQLEAGLKALQTKVDYVAIYGDPLCVDRFKQQCAAWLALANVGVLWRRFWQMWS